MRSVALFAVLLAASAPAFADGLDIHRGQVLRDAKNVRVGTIDSVAADGTVGLVVDAAYVRVPASTISMVDGKLVTKMTKREIQGH